MFDYNMGLTIGYRRNGRRYCLSADISSYPFFEDCEIRKTAWIYDSYRRYIVHPESCLTALHRKAVYQERCQLEPQSATQIWKFEFENKDDPTFKRVYPNITIEDWEFAQEELRSAPAESTSDKDNVFNWGNLIHKTRKGSNDHQVCMSFTSDMINVTTEPCRRQDKEFYQQNHMFEYATDYTIRRINTNYCLKIESLAILEKCNENSMRWGMNEITGQIMELQSIKCSENRKRSPVLGSCNNDQRPRKHGNSNFTIQH